MSRSFARLVANDMNQSILYAPNHIYVDFSMVNNDPMNGVVKKEPLNTLSTYRKVDNSILFGTNIMSLNEGEINIGDALVF